MSLPRRRHKPPGARQLLQEARQVRPPDRWCAFHATSRRPAMRRRLWRQRAHNVLTRPASARTASSIAAAASPDRRQRLAEPLNFLPQCSAARRVCSSAARRASRDNDPCSAYAATGLDGFPRSPRRLVANGLNILVVGNRRSTVGSQLAQGVPSARREGRPHTLELRARAAHTSLHHLSRLRRSALEPILEDVANKRTRPAPVPVRRPQSPPASQAAAGPQLVAQGGLCARGRVLLSTRHAIRFAMYSAATHSPKALCGAALGRDWTGRRYFRPLVFPRPLMNPEGGPMPDVKQPAGIVALIEPAIAEGQLPRATYLYVLTESLASSRRVKPPPTECLAMT